MKKHLLPAAIILTFLLLILNLPKVKNPKGITTHRENALPFSDDEGEKDEDGIAAAQEMEFELTRDVSLGYIPKFRLVTAYENLINQRKLRPNTPENASSLSWAERGPNSDVVGASNSNKRAGNGISSGRIRAIWIDLSDPTNHTVWVGGVDGGIWKTTDISASPATWTPVNDFLGNLAIGSICQDPLGTKDTMYFGTGEKAFNADAVRGGGIWKSVDHGSTWNLLTNTTSFYNVSKIICDAVGNIYAATIGNGSGIERSTDGGKTWSNITPQGLNSNVTDMKLSSTGTIHIVCGYRNAGVSGYRFTNNPATVTPSTWSSPSVLFPNDQYNCELAVSGNTVYVLPANSSYQTPKIYKSIDGGITWAATVTSPPAASGNNDLSSGQAWYDMALAVDPSNDQNVIAGGLNCFRTTNGGNTWSQVSTWVGSSLSYIHADQQIAVWQGNEVLVGSDGGIFYSSDGGATFKDRNAGLRIKQFYSCAMHPTNINYFLLGAQDNGINQLTNAGLGGSTEVTGGDGAFVQIDQDEPQYQFGSYVYNTYMRSTDGGNSWSSVDYSNAVGLFINPRDYDNIDNKMYAAGGNNQYIRWEDPHTGGTFTPITVNAFSGSVRHVSVSPYTSNRVLFGSSGGKIVKVDNANTDNPIATDITDPLMPTTNVSCIAFGTDDNNLLATYSNYGAIKHIWVTNSGGGSGGWTNITGNFPDIPVRWAIFYPDDNTKAIIATEMGVYETSNINGSSTVWTQDANFPIVRTDMLKYRKSDGTVAAATHGRGLWTATIPLTIPYIRFAAGFNDQPEATSDTDGCRYYKDYSVNLNIDLPPTGNANVSLTVANGGTAKQGIDFDFTTNGSFVSPSGNLTFASGSSASQHVTIRIYDDAEIENRESFTLNYTVSGTTNAQLAPSSNSYTFYISDNDYAPVENGASDIFTVGTASYLLGDTSAGQPFNAKLAGKRSQMLYKAAELTAAGISPGTITSVAFNMQKYSTRPYQNLEIKMGTTSVTNLVDEPATNDVPTSTVKSLASYTTVGGWNNFTLDAPFVWDGTSSIVIEVCYNNGTADVNDHADRTIGYDDGSTSTQGNLMWQDNINCGNPFTNVDYYSNGTKPQLQLGVTAFGNLIATYGTQTEQVSNNGTYYFYTGNNILNKITSSSANLGCVSSVISDSGSTWQPFSGGMRSQKVFDITPSSNSGASYTIGLYYTTKELAGKDPATLQIAKTDVATISAANITNSILSTTTYASYANGYLFTAAFTGFSKFFLVDANTVLPVTLLSFNGDLSDKNILLNWETSSEHGLKYFEIEKSGNGNNFYVIGKKNATGLTSSISDYNYTDGQVDELNYYRLKSVDVDNHFIYSTTILIKNPNASQHLRVGNNPFRDLIKINLAKVSQQSIRVELMNVNGAKVYLKWFGATNEIDVDLAGMHLSPGIYLLQTTVDGKNYINKLVRQ